MWVQNINVNTINYIHARCKSAVPHMEAPVTGYCKCYVHLMFLLMWSKGCDTVSAHGWYQQWQFQCHFNCLSLGTSCTRRPRQILYRVWSIFTSIHREWEEAPRPSTILRVSWPILSRRFFSQLDPWWATKLQPSAFIFLKWLDICLRFFHIYHHGYRDSSVLFCWIRSGKYKKKHCSVVISTFCLASERLLVQF